MYSSQCLFCHTNIAKCHTLPTKDFCWTTSASPHSGRLPCSCFFGMSICMKSRQKQLQNRLPPWWDSSLASNLHLKILMLTIPHPLWISNDLSWGGYGYFLELHILTFNWSPHTFVRNTQKTASNQTNHQILIGDADCHNINFISENVLDCIVHGVSIIQVIANCILAT